MSRFKAGDVVLLHSPGHDRVPRGLAIVIEAIDAAGVSSLPSLRLHDGTSWKSCYYMHPNWCEKVGEVDDGVVRFCLESHAQMEPLVAERMKRLEPHE